MRIATRSSALALWQAEHVAGLIRERNPDCRVELVHVSTEGDRNLTGPLRELGGEGVFTREVQRAVLEGRAELAVHSLKDLPTLPTEGLLLAGVPPRATTEDALVLPGSERRTPDREDRPSPEQMVARLPVGARIGTGSPRRRAQLLHVRPDFHMLDVRGNVLTRLKKLDSGEYDALVLAVAGLARLGLEDRVSSRFGPPLMYSAVGQGALGIECARSDEETVELCRQITDSAVLAAVQAERQLLAELRAGCHAPLGVATRIEGDQLLLEGVVLRLDGGERIYARASGSLSEPLELGVLVAQELLRQGADRLVRPAT